MKSLTKKLHLPKNMKWFEWLWLGLPIAVWFSFYPLILIGQNETMYFELSISVIYLVIVACASLPLVWRARQELLHNRAVWLSGAFLLVYLVSLIWTPNIIRGVLTCGIVGALVMVFYGMLAQSKNLRRMAEPIARVFVAMTVLMSMLAIVQFIAGIWLNQSVTLLCAGCQATQFGFVRPNGFTVEPQFLGSLLVLGILLIMQKLVKNPSPWILWAGFGLVFVALILTLSRGAIFSLLAGGVIFAVVNWRQWRRTLLVILAGFLSVIIALIMQGCAAKINPTVRETFNGAIEKSVNQLSMGVIDLNLPEDKIISEVPVINADVKAVENPTPAKEDPAFDGYVEESTNIRLKLSEAAISAWSRDLLTILFGTGAGGSGIAMSQAVSDIGQKEIVQNQYVETLLEIGILGFAVFLLILAALFVVTKNNRWIWAIITSVMVQWLFFSGYPNALHIYLMLIIVAAFTLHRDQSKLAKRC